MQTCSFTVLHTWGKEVRKENREDKMYNLLVDSVADLLVHRVADLFVDG